MRPHSSALVRYFFFPLGALMQCLIHGQATLVEGPNDAHLVYNNAQLSITLDIQCGIDNGIAACTGNSGYDVTPLIFPTQPAQPFLVQGGDPLTVSPAAPSSSSVLPPQTTTSSGFITTSAASSSLTTSPASPSSVDSALNPSSSTVSNDERSNVVVQIPLLIAFVVMTAALL